MKKDCGCDFSKGIMCEAHLNKAGIDPTKPFSAGPIKPPIYAKTAPPDRVALKAWRDIMAIASDNALIVQAYGGVATLVIPSEQRKAGLRQQALTANLMNETKEVES